MSELHLRVIETAEARNINLTIEARIDGAPLLDLKKYSVGAVWGLYPSTTRSGGFFIITCTCGDPGCGGIWNPVTVEHGPGVVNWRITEPAPVREFQFEKDAYVNEVTVPLREAKRLFAARSQGLSRERQRLHWVPHLDQQFTSGDR